LPVTISKLVGEERMQKGARAEVIEIIRTLPEGPVTKRYLFGRWLTLVYGNSTVLELDAVALRPER
jgi:hypothetical protein